MFIKRAIVLLIFCVFAVVIKTAKTEEETISVPREELEEGGSLLAKDVPRTCYGAAEIQAPVVFSELLRALLDEDLNVRMEGEDVNGAFNKMKEIHSQLSDVKQTRQRNYGYDKPILVDKAVMENRVKLNQAESRLRVFLSIHGIEVEVLACREIRGIHKWLKNNARKRRSEADFRKERKNENEFLDCLKRVQITENNLTSRGESFEPRSPKDLSVCLNYLAKLEVQFHQVLAKEAREQKLLAQAAKEAEEAEREKKAKAESAEPEEQKSFAEAPALSSEEGDSESEKPAAEIPASPTETFLAAVPEKENSPQAEKQETAKEREDKNAEKGKEKEEPQDVAQESDRGASQKGEPPRQKAQQDRAPASPPESVSELVDLSKYQNCSLKYEEETGYILIISCSD